MLFNSTMLLILQLLHLGKEYPGGYPYFRNKLKNAFLKNSSLKESKEIDSAIARGEFVIKELEGNNLILLLCCVNKDE